MTELALRTQTLPATTNQHLPAIIGAPSEHEMIVFKTMAAAANSSKQYKHVGDENAILITMLAARELQIPPMMALNKGIQNINGSIEISARLMHALMRRSGVFIEIQQSDNEACRIYGRRPDGSSHTVKYEILEAKQAGLVKPGGGWTKNPSDMLFARAISRLARQLAPDVIGGCYVEGEIQDRRIVHAEEEVASEPDNEPLTLEIVDRSKLYENESEINVNRFVAAVALHYQMSENELIKQFNNNIEAFRKQFGIWKQKNSKILTIGDTNVSQ